MHMMSEFVCQHHFDLVGCIAIQHRVTYYNAACIAQSHKRGISSCCLITHFHREDTAHFGMSTLCKGQQALRQFSLWERCEFIEERKDQNGGQICHHHREEEHNQPNL